MRKFLYLFLLFFSTQVLADSFQEIPVSYQGRFRPIDAASRLWLYQIYHRQSLKQEHLAATPKAIDLVWKLHLYGHKPFDDTPLFWIHDAELKTLLGLPVKDSHFSYRQFSHLLKENKLANTKEVSQLKQTMDLYTSLQGSVLPENDLIAAAVEQMKARNITSGEIAHNIEMQHPLHQRLTNAGSLIKALPGKYQQGEWFSLHALNVKVFDITKNQLAPVGNFTLYSDKEFESIRKYYLAWEADPTNDQLNALANQLIDSYQSLVGTPYAKAIGKILTYPSLLQLKMEMVYYTYPWTWVIILLYSLACLCWILSFKMNNRIIDKTAMTFMIMAFALHTAVLVMRCIILQRPPVSNMFETVVYVPWIAVLVSFLFFNRLIILSAGIASIGLLIILELTDLNNSLDNVQAVLDSQFWLIIHVLMIVGSYGVFLLSSILGHLYLCYYLYEKKETPMMKILAGSILQTLYLGVVLLIPGTILGGVWAAESWGRFWDWDPKESWAFISSCVYLIWIHAYRFHKIRNFGLAIGSVLGFLAISFTWYGVNYILGTGLHSYGFGSGGEIYYYLFIAFELIFIGLVIQQKGTKTYKKLSKLDH